MEKNEFKSLFPTGGKNDAFAATTGTSITKVARFYSAQTAGAITRSGENLSKNCIPAMWSISRRK